MLNKTEFMDFVKFVIRSIAGSHEFENFRFIEQDGCVDAVNPKAYCKKGIITDDVYYSGVYRFIPLNDGKVKVMEFTGFYCCFRDNWCVLDVEECLNGGLSAILGGFKGLSLSKLRWFFTRYYGQTTPYDEYLNI